MALLAQFKRNVFTGAATAYSAGGAAIATMNGSNIALNTIVAGTTSSSAGLVMAVANSDFEWDTLAALVQYKLTTSTITVTGKWQGSYDGVNWSDLVGLNAPANVQLAAAGTGSLVTTTVIHSFAGLGTVTPYIRYAVLSGVVTGAAGDSVIVSYSFRKRWRAA